MSLFPLLKKITGHKLNLRHALHRAVSLFLAVLLLAACATEPVRKAETAPAAPSEQTEPPAFKQLDLTDRKIQKQDKVFRKYLNKELGSNQKAWLSAQTVEQLTARAPLAKITRPDGDYILVFSAGDSLKAFTYDKNDTLFGWSTAETLKNTSSELLLVFYDYRLNENRQDERTEGDLKYVLFLQIDKKGKHYNQFIYNKDKELLCGQMDNEVFARSEEENLFIPRSAYSAGILPSEPLKDGFPIIEVAEGVVQAGAMAAVIASAFSLLPAWIWIGYVGAGSAPWIFLMIACNVGMC